MEAILELLLENLETSVVLLGLSITFSKSLSSKPNIILDLVILTLKAGGATVTSQRKSLVFVPFLTVAVMVVTYRLPLSSP